MFSVLKKHHKTVNITYLNETKNFSQKLKVYCLRKYDKDNKQVKTIRIYARIYHSGSVVWMLTS